MTSSASVWAEKDLRIDFAGAVAVFSLDQHGKGHGLTHRFKGVDIVVEWQDAIWLVEVKDPENSRIPPQHLTMQQKNFQETVASKSLIEQELYPKLIDTLLFLALDRGIPAKPLRYFAILCLSSLDPVQLSHLQDKLLRHDGDWLKGPSEGWGKAFSAHIFNLESWNRNFPKYPLTRIGG
ncbi:MAG: hypothetical protein HQL96_02790 [Magnetococcales bacterium]|nr:hypothetical protein [Magnetococcales bacterium]